MRPGVLNLQTKPSVDSSAHTFTVQRGWLEAVILLLALILFISLTITVRFGCGSRIQMRIGVEKSCEIKWFELCLFVCGFFLHSKHQCVESHHKTGHDSVSHCRGSKGVKI